MLLLYAILALIVDCFAMAIMLVPTSYICEISYRGTSLLSTRTVHFRTYSCVTSGAADQSSAGDGQCGFSSCIARIAGACRHVEGASS